MQYYVPSTPQSPGWHIVTLKLASSICLNSMYVFTFVSMIEKGEHGNLRFFPQQLVDNIEFLFAFWVIAIKATFVNIFLLIAHRTTAPVRLTTCLNCS
jgi:hypothetical protein